MSSNKFSFRSPYGETIFKNRYAKTKEQTWEEKSDALVHEVCDGLMKPSDIQDLIHYMGKMYFIPAGRYLASEGKKRKFYNNCYLFKGNEDTTEEWGRLIQSAFLASAAGGGLGIDYSVFRESGVPLKSKGGVASGPIALMQAINEVGRSVKTGGSRRVALYGSLNWQHGDADKMLTIKDWDHQMLGNTGLTYGDMKKEMFDFACPLDHTNISLNYDNEFLNQLWGYNKYGSLNWAFDQNGIYVDPNAAIKSLPSTYLENIRYALTNGEPGFSFNFGLNEKETLRNACTESTSFTDSDNCNLGTLNFGYIPDLITLTRCIELGTKFLICGTVRGEVPNHRMKEIRDKDRRIGLGIMGLHEWLLKRSYPYEVVAELKDWLSAYKLISDDTAEKFAFDLEIPTPIKKRAIAPNGTIAALPGTTSGIEPIFAVSYKRRYLDKEIHKYQYVIDGTAKALINEYGLNPYKIESAIDLAENPEKRIKFQADIQDYVDQAISSTINMPPWGSELNNEDTINDFAHTLAKYAHRLRGFTCYPDGGRGGQPLTSCDYEEAKKNEGIEFVHDPCEMNGRATACGV